jgi:hypothetical protein
MRQRPEVVRRALLGYSTSTPSRSKPSASDLPNSDPPPQDRLGSAEYSGDVLMTDPIQPGDDVPQSAAPSLHNATLNSKGPAHKTPARPTSAAVNRIISTSKPSAKSFPRYQSGDSIDLSKIPTDSEDEDSEHEAAKNRDIPRWSNNPALNQGLLIQETIDPVSDADAVVTPSRTLLPSSARTAPPNYSSPFGESEDCKYHQNC